MGTKPQAASQQTEAGFYDRQLALVESGVALELVWAWSWLWERAGFAADRADFTLSQLAAPRNAAKPTAKLWVDGLQERPALIQVIEARTGRRGGYSVEVLDPFDVLPERLRRIDAPADAAQRELALEDDGEQSDQPTTEPTEPPTVPFPATGRPADPEPPPRPAAELNVQRSDGSTECLPGGDAGRAASESRQSPANADPPGGNVQPSDGSAERLAVPPSRTRVVSLEERNNLSSSINQSKKPTPNQSQTKQPERASAGARRNPAVLRGTGNRSGELMKAGDLLKRAGGTDGGAMGDRGTRAYEEAKSNASRRVLQAVRLAEARTGVSVDDDQNFMRPWVAYEWGHHFAQGTIGLVDVDEIVRDLAEIESFKKSPGAFAQYRGRKLVTERGGEWRAGAKHHRTE